MKDHGNYFYSGVSQIPHPLKIATGGEDGYFIDSEIMGVADGVSAWKIKFGIDAGVFAKALCSNMKESYLEWKELDGTSLNLD